MTKNALTSFATDSKINVADSGLLTGFRNKIINGDFDIWQRSTSVTTSGYVADDRWINSHNGSTKTTSQQVFTLGQSDVPGSPKYFSRTVVTTSAGAANFVLKTQRIEGVSTLSGKTATLTFYAKADAGKDIAISFKQNFGTTGSPSSEVGNIDIAKHTLTTAWQKFQRIVTIPSISGKTLGSDGNDYLELQIWFEAGSDFNASTLSLGQQSGTFDIAHVSLVEGDATGETDPFSKRFIGQELALCQRYYVKTTQTITWQGSVISGATYTLMHWLPITMFTAPTLSFGNQSVTGFPGGNPTASDVSTVSFRTTRTANATQNSGFFLHNFIAEAEL